jgi:RimJ/RimL family protein N-acetyltransferase
MLTNVQEPEASPVGRISQETTGSQPGASLRASVDRLPRFSSQEPLEWWHQLPELVSGRLRLREVRLSDAPSLTAVLGAAEVAQHLSPGPTSLAQTEQFIAWSRRARMSGRYICFGVSPFGLGEAVGVFQIWPLEPSFGTAEWGFALGQRFWGTGLFEAGARLVMDFAFETLGVQRLEARAAVDNVRGNAALKKIGAVPEGVLRKCFRANGEYRDHVMWSTLAEDWRAASGPIRLATGESS